MSYAEFSFYTGALPAGTTAVQKQTSFYRLATDSARFYLDVAGFAGTSIDVTIRGVLNTKKWVLATFTQVTAATASEMKEVANCPDDIEVEVVVVGSEAGATLELIAHRV